MTSFIHPTALVSKHAELGVNVHIGPYCIVDAGAVIEDGCVLISHVHVWGGVRVGRETRIYQGAVVGSDPQDLKYRGQKSSLLIGANCKIREYCTLNRGTEEGSQTVLADNVLTMAYVHVAHDCVVGEGAVLANGVQLGGHVELGAYCVIGGNTAVHQFSKVGAFAFVGGTLKIDCHVPPYIKALGDPLTFAGINHIAFKRHSLPSELEKVRKFYRKIYLGKENWESLIQEENGLEEVTSFFKENRGGVLGRKI